MVNIRCSIFKTEAWLLASVRFDQCSCALAFTASTSHEKCADVRIWSPGDVIISCNIQREILLPGSIIWAPLHTGITGVVSSTHESTGLQSVVVSVILSSRQHAGHPGWRVIYLSHGSTRDKNSIWNVDCLINDILRELDSESTVTSLGIQWELIWAWVWKVLILDRSGLDNTHLIKEGHRVLRRW